MNVLLALAWRSLRNRPVTSLLTVTAVALSITLLLGVEQARRGMSESFTGTIKGTDLVVGARGGTLQLLLGAVFGIGAPTGSVPYDVYETWTKHPAIKWTVPQTFDQVLNYLLDLLFSRDPILRQHKHKRLTRTVLFYMYWICDIGKEEDATT